jgi:hypothetical protein
LQDHLQDLTPRILLQLKNITVNSGDPVKFQGQAEGNPPPIISWYKDDEILEFNSRIKEFKENNTYILLLMETIALDSGCYEMVAENNHGKAYTRAYLTVIGENEKHEQKQDEILFNEQNIRMIPMSSKYTQPFIELQLQDQTVREGSSVKFECIIAHSESNFFKKKISYF